MSPISQEEWRGASESRSSRARKRRRRSITVTALPRVAPSEPPSQGGGSSESRSSRAKKRRRRSLTVTTQPLVAPSEAGPASHRGKQRRSKATKVRSKTRQRARAAVKNREEEENAAKRAEESREEDQEAVATSDSSAASSSDASSTVSSPARFPCFRTTVLPCGMEVPVDFSPEVERIYLKELSKYKSKREQDQSLPTLDESIYNLGMNTRELLPVRDSVTKTILHAAKFVVGLSSHVDGKPLARSSGFFIDWDEKTRRGTVLTSAHIICTKFESGTMHTPGTREYEIDSQVTVHINCKITINACLLHLDKHYNLAVFECDMNLSPQLPCLSDDVTCAQDVFFLGRSERLILDINYGKVLWRVDHHRMYADCKYSECDSGGPVINFDGDVVGMADATTTMSFIPVSVLLKFLRLLKKFNCIPRLHLGLKLSAIKFLYPSHIELISNSYGITEGLIVKKVAVGSAAEKVGIRIGDIIEYCNGESLDTTAKLDDILLRICEDHFDKGNGLGSSVELTVDVFRVRQEYRSTKKLALIVSDELEVFVEEGTYMVSTREGPSTVVSSVVV